MTTPVISSVDGWVDQAGSATNHGQDAYISLNGTAGSLRYGYVFFAPPFPATGAAVSAATMNVYLAETWSGTHTITATRITSSWAENTLTYTTAPSVSSTNSGSVTIVDGVDGQLGTIGLTSMMGDVAAGGTFYGVRLAQSGTTSLRLYGAEHPDQTKRASLDVNWSIAPEAPVNLTPSGSYAVSPAAPIIDWEFDSKDYTTERLQASSRVQISTSTDFTSPVFYDSGTVANVQTNFDVSIAGTAGAAGSLIAGSTYYSRARVVDDAGQASAWSDTAQFVRQTAGTLTLTNPPAAGTVNETTPPITWTFTGRTQEAYELVLNEYLSGSVPSELWRAPKTVGTATSYTLPNNLIRSSGTYNLIARVWDTIDRQLIANATDYVEVSRDFTYTRPGGPAAVSSLTVTEGTATDAESSLDVSWTYGTTPNYFSLRVNSIEVEDRLLPADVLVSGTNYTYHYWGGTPGVSSTIEVEAVVAT
jgi:hypothetical protein